MLDQLAARRSLDKRHSAPSATIAAVVLLMLAPADLVRDHGLDVNAVSLHSLIVDPHRQGVSVVDAVLLTSAKANDARQETQL
jgi:hypothetical protein